MTILSKMGWGKCIMVMKRAQASGQGTNGTKEQVHKVLENTKELHKKKQVHKVLSEPKEQVNKILKKPLRLH